MGPLVAVLAWGPDPDPSTPQSRFWGPQLGLRSFTFNILAELGHPAFPHLFYDGGSPLPLHRPSWEPSLRPQVHQVRQREQRRPGQLQSGLPSPHNCYGHLSDSQNVAVWTTTWQEGSGVRPPWDCCCCHGGGVEQGSREKPGALCLGEACTCLPQPWLTLGRYTVSRSGPRPERQGAVGRHMAGAAPSPGTSLSLTFQMLILAQEAEAVAMDIASWSQPKMSQPLPCSPL